VNSPENVSLNLKLSSNDKLTLIDSHSKNEVERAIGMIKFYEEARKLRKRKKRLKIKQFRKFQQKRRQSNLLYAASPYTRKYSISNNYRKITFGERRKTRNLLKDTSALSD